MPYRDQAQASDIAALASDQTPDGSTIGGSSSAEPVARKPKPVLGWRILRTTGKVLAWVLGSVVVLLGVVLIALQFSSVQTFITGKASGWLEGKIGTKVRIARVDIDLIKTIVLEGVYAEDRSGDTLLYAGALRADVGLFAFGKQEININSVALEHAVIKLRKPADKDTFNFAYIVSAFSSPDTTAPDPADTGKGWTVDAEKLRLTDVHFLLDNSYAHTLLDLRLGEVTASIADLGLATQRPVIDEFAIRGARVRFEQPAADTAAYTDSAVAKVKELADPNKAIHNPANKVLNESGWGGQVAKLTLDDVGIVYLVKGIKMKPGPKTAKVFDYKHLDVRGLALTLTDVAVGANDIEASLDRLRFAERNSGFVLSNLAVKAKVHAPAYEVTVKELRLPHSVLNDGITAGIRNLEDTANLIGNTYLRARFRGDSVSVRDLLPFAPVLDSLGLSSLALKLGGDVQTKGQQAILTDLIASVNPTNFVRLRGRVGKFLSPDSLRLEEMGHEVRVDPRFVARFLPKNTLPPEVFKLGQMHLTGQASGTLRGLAGRLALESRAGRLVAERYYYKSNQDFSAHEGTLKLSTPGLEPGVVLGPGLGLGRVQFSADLAGGYSPKGGLALRRGNVVVQSARYKAYTYTNLRVEATYLAKIAKAHIRYADRAAQTNLLVTADLRPKNPRITLRGPIAADLRALRLTKDTLNFRLGMLTAAVQGTDPNTMQARVMLRQANVVQGVRRANLDSLLVILGQDSGQRLLAIQSEVIQARMLGRYDLALVGDAVTEYVRRFVPLTSIKVRPVRSEQRFRLTAHVPTHPKALEVLVPDLQVVQPILLDMTFNNRKQQLDTRLTVQDLRYAGGQVAGLNFTTNSESNRWNIAAKAEVVAQDSFIIPKPEIDFDIKKNVALFRLRIAAEEADSRARLEGRILGIGDITRLTLSKSELYLKKQEWKLDQNALLEVGAKHLLVKDFRLENQQDTTKYIAVQTPDGKKHNAIAARIHNLEIADVTRLIPPLGYNLQGRLNLEAGVDDVFTVAGVKADLKVDSLMVNGRKAGNLTLTATQPNKTLVNLEALLKNGGNGIKVAGAYNLADTNRALDFRLRAEDFHPQEISPVLYQYVKRWEGTVNADITLKGRVAAPKIAGYVNFDSINYIQPTATQVVYQLINQKLFIAKDRLSLNKFTIGDDRGSNLIVDGGIGIQNLSTPTIDLAIKADNFHIINTRATDNESFFGTAYITTNMQVAGPAANMTVKGRVTTEEGTRVTYNIAAGGPGTAAMADFIQMFSSQDSTNMAARLDIKKEEKTEVQGFGLELGIRLKKGTRFMVIIDPKTGDRLECEGVADLKFSMAPNGVINLVGDYRLSDGFYSMNLLGLVSRKFKVRDGSTLSWTGDPANAGIDLTAAYTTKAARFELVADQEDAMSSSEIAAAKRREPVSVLLKITKTITEPDIKFDIEVPDQAASGGSSIVASRITQIQQNENELNKQALGLIAFNRFVNTGETTGGGGLSTTEQVNDRVNSTVSDVLSRQLSNLSAEYLGGVEIGVNLQDNQDPSGGTTNSFTDKQVGVSISKQLINDRLRVSVGSNVGGSGSSTSSGGQPVIGDLTAEYRLDKKGELNAKFFRNYNQNFYTSTSSERIGASIAQNKNFSSFKRLFMSRDKRSQLMEAERERKTRSKEQATQE